MKNGKGILIIIIIVVIIILLIFGIIYILNPDIFNSSMNNNVVTEKMSYSVVHVTGITKNENITTSDISVEYFVILNSDGIIIDTIAKEKGYTSDELTQAYNNLASLKSDFRYNAQIKDDYLKYNIRYWNGNDKSKIINYVGNLENLVINEI